MKKQKILIAMSGGVDSSVAAAMLKKQGHDVIGGFLKFWTPRLSFSQVQRTRRESDFGQARMTFKENICCNQEALRSARNVANKLKIPFYVFDIAKEFKREVVDYYINEYDSGRTPNPCVVCNKKIKFGWLLEKAKELGCEYVATGHYARCKAPTRIKTDIDTDQNGFKLLQAKDKVKDQTYFLWQLSQKQLQHILFPLDNYTKPEVREMAQAWNLPVYNKKESQDICFIPDGDNADFLQSYVKKLNKPGNIADKLGNILGKHQGLYQYTVGQRQGLPQLAISHKRLANSKHRIPAMYVIKLNTDKNELVVGVEKDLYSKKLIATNINFIDKKLHATRYTLHDFKCKAKIRYGHSAASCELKAKSYKLKAVEVIFDKPQRAITPGQSVVFYQDDGELIGGGIIK